MTYGYQRPDPKEAFRNAIRYYRDLMDIAMEEGYTKEQAIEIIKVYCLFGIDSNLSAMGGNY